MNLKRRSWETGAREIDAHVKDIKRRLVVWKQCGAKDPTLSSGRVQSLRVSRDNKKVNMWDGYASDDSAPSRPVSARPGAEDMGRKVKANHHQEEEKLTNHENEKEKEKEKEKKETLGMTTRAPSGGASGIRSVHDAISTRAAQDQGTSGLATGDIIADVDDVDDNESVASSVSEMGDENRGDLMLELVST